MMWLKLNKIAEIILNGIVVAFVHPSFLIQKEQLNVDRHFLLSIFHLVFSNLRWEDIQLMFQFVQLVLDFVEKQNH